MIVIGHRGAAGISPENSMESLRAGVKAGAEMLEFDVRLTYDNVPIILHDSTLKRTHNIPRDVQKISFQELQNLTKNQPVPALSEVLDEFLGLTPLNIELKGKGTGKIVAEALLSRLQSHPTIFDDNLISSFKASELFAVRKRTNLARLGLLHDRNPFIFLAYHQPLKLAAVGFHHQRTNPLTTLIAKKNGLFIYAYTEDQPEKAEKLARSGFDGVVTNHPEKYSTKTAL